MSSIVNWVNDVGSRLLLSTDCAGEFGAALALAYCLTLAPLLAIFLFFRSSSASPRSKGKAAISDLVKLPAPEELALLIRERRSIFPKDFCYDPVHRRVVLAMLEAANWAPTHGKTEPWRFVVLGRSAQEQLVDLSLSVLKRELPADKYEFKRKKMEGKREKDYTKVPYFIAICMKRQANPQKLMPEWEEVAAVSCAVQNMWLTATALGAAGYWTSWTPEARESQEMKDFLKLETEDKCLGFFILGTCREPEKYRSTRGPVSEKTDWRL